MNNWKTYRTIHKGVGTLCEVLINEQDGLIRRNFNKDSITVSGRKTRFNPQRINLFFDNEVKWLRELESEWIPKTVEINHNEKYIIQEYYNDDLLCHKKKSKIILPDLEEQILEMYKFFKSKNVYKRNGSLSNLTWNDNQLIAFDFKWAMSRPLGLEKEIYSYDNYLSKVNLDLPKKLKSLLS
jgi:hypothetical protein